jgi:hypothetical protein
MPGAVGGGDGGAAAAVELHASLTQRLSAHTTLSGAEHGADSSERNFSHGGSSGSLGREDTNRCGELTVAALLKRANAMALRVYVGLRSRQHLYCFAVLEPFDSGLEPYLGDATGRATLHLRPHGGRARA